MKPDVLSDLDKVIEGWEYIVGHEKGTISKAMMEQIIKTIQLLHGYKQARQETAREIFEEIEKKWGWVSDKLDKIVIDDYGYWGRENSLKDWQSLKSKFGVKK